MDLLPTVIKKQFDPHLYSAYGEALSTSSSVQLNDRMFPQFVGGMQNYNNLSYDSRSFFSNYFKCSPMEDVLLKRKRQLELIDQKVKETNCKIERINCEFRRDVRKLLDFNKNKILNDSLSKEKSVSELLEEISKYKDTSYFMREMPLSSLFEFKIPNNVKKVRTLVDHEPSSLLLSETPTPDTTLFVLNKGILQPDYPMMNRMKKKVNQCPHKDAKHYAKNMCSNCYHSNGRMKKPWMCNHIHKSHYAHGLCQNCYQSNYTKSKKYGETLSSFSNVREL